jgi:hypothetical protein
MKHAKKACVIAFTLYNLIIADNAQPHRIAAEISYGELIDKITILKIKSERITDPEKLINILTELTSLLKTLVAHVSPHADITNLMQELKTVNEALWDVEDALRIKEKIKDFDDDFIQLARSVYITNDQRFVLKKKVDALLGSPISEEKSYESYI